MIQTIYLIRHGEIPQSTPRRFVGQRDLPLTDKGHVQIARVAEFLAACSVAGILTSPLTRCIESGHILKNGLQISDVRTEPGLKEISLGDWEGLTVKEVQRDFPGEYEARGCDIAGFRPSGGESFSDLLGRIWPVFDNIAAEAGDPIAIVAHAGVNRMLLCRILGMPIANMFRLVQDYGCVNILQREGGEYTLRGLNLHP